MTYKLRLSNDNDNDIDFPNGAAVLRYSLTSKNYLKTLLTRSAHMTHPTHFNPALDLNFERIIDVPPHAVWRAWTEPELLKQWFCPKPWTTIDAQVDVRPGGLFRTTMQSPEGQAFPNKGCYLETVKNEKLVWTNALLPNFRPAPVNAPCGDESVEFMFTATVEMLPHGEGGTHYRATVTHADEKGCQQHAAMGFEAGWGAALDQLVAMVKKGI